MTQWMDERQRTETQKQVVVTAICFEGRWITGYLAAAFHARPSGQKTSFNALYVPEHLVRARILFSDECPVSIDGVPTRQFAGSVRRADTARRLMVAVELRPR